MYVTVTCLCNSAVVALNYMMNILVVEDHQFFRDAVEACVKDIVQDANVLGFQTLRETQIALTQLKSNAHVNLDLGLKDSSGIGTVTQIREGWPDVRILVLSAEEDLQLQHILQSHGVAGYVPKTKSVPEVREAIAAFLRGETVFDPIVGLVDGDDLEKRLARLRSLTDAQMRVLRAMADGSLNKQIAHDLGISEVTVKFHVKSVLSKLEVANRTQAVIELNTLEKYGQVK